MMRAYLLIGRLADARILTNVSMIETSQTTLRFRGRIGIDASDLAAIAIVRDQINALKNNVDEPVVRLYYSGDTTLSAWVRPVDATVNMEPGALEDGHWPFTIDVERLDRGVPRLVTRFGGTVMVNAQSIIESEAHPWHGTPSTETGYTFGLQGGTYSTRTGPEGTVRIRDVATTVPYFTGSASFHLPEVNAYDMAAHIMVGDFPNRHTVNGRLISASAAPTSWEIGNGLFKVTAGGAGTSLLQFTSPVFAGPANYGTPVEVDVGFLGAGPGWYAWGSAYIVGVAVMRNSPECCVLRLSVAWAPSGGTSSSVYDLYINVRRGARHALLTIDSPIPEQWGVGTTTATGMTAQTIHAAAIGIKRTASDVDGNRFFVFMPKANARDLVNGRIYNTAAVQTCAFGIGHEVGGAGAASVDDAGSQGGTEAGGLVGMQFFAAQSEYQRVVVP